MPLNDRNARAWAIEQMVRGGHHFSSVTDLINDAQAVAAFVERGVEPGDRPTGFAVGGPLIAEEDQFEVAAEDRARRVTSAMVDRARAVLEPLITGTIRPEDMRVALEAALGSD